MIRPVGDEDRGAWFDFWRGSVAEWEAWHNRTEPTSLPGEKRRGVAYAIAFAILLVGVGIGAALR